ncbi:ABC transporter permease [Candidatus Peribacteria bacterium]|nr:MAG: ABC transporter permease [Candidatus Peribacteria bacterium]
MGTIYILWLRQLKRYVRSKSRIIGSLGQPLLFLLALGYGLGPVFEQAGQGSYVQFIAPGVISMSVLFMAVFGGIEIIWDRQFGFLKETLVAPVPRWQIMLGRTLGGATVAVIQGLIIFVITIIAGFRPESWALLPLAFLFITLLALLFTAMGTAIACLLEDMQAFPIIMNFLVMPIFFLSGAIFPLSNLPGPIAILTKINPLSYGVDGLRGALTGALEFSYSLDITVLVVVTAIILAIGTWLFSRIQV